jgi:nucleoside recognition membrane protein YjiH
MLSHMIDLLDFLASVLGEDLAPATRRGLGAIFGVTFLVLLAATLWALMISPRPLRTGTLVLLASTVMVGGVGVVLALIDRARSRSDRNSEASI